MSLNGPTHIVAAVNPQNTNSVAVDGKWVDLTNFDCLTVVLYQGFYDTSSINVTLEQAQDNAGTGAAVLGFTEVKRGSNGLPGSDQLESVIVVGDAHPLDADEGKYTFIEIHAGDLTQGNKSVRVRVADPGLFDAFISIIYILTRPNIGTTDTTTAN